MEVYTQILYAVTNSATLSHPLLVRNSMVSWLYKVFLLSMFISDFLYISKIPRCIVLRSVLLLLLNKKRSKLWEIKERQLCQNWMFEFEIVEETTVSELNVWIWNCGRDNFVRTECLNLKSWKRQLCQNWMFEFEIVEVKRNGLINSASIKLLILCFKCWPSAVWCCLILMFFCLVWYVPTSSSFTYLYHLCWWNIFFPLFSFWSFCLFCTNFLMQT